MIVLRIAGGIAPPPAPPAAPGATYGSSFPRDDRRGGDDRASSRDDRRDDRDRDRFDDRRDERRRSRSPPRDREPPRPAGPCSVRCPPTCDNARIYISGLFSSVSLLSTHACHHDRCCFGGLGLPDDVTVGDVKDLFGSFGIIASVGAQRLALLSCMIG